MFDLLKEGADRLANHIERSDVLSLAGRAPFFRFLQDREIITDRNSDQIAPGAGTLKACFYTGENSAATCSCLTAPATAIFFAFPPAAELIFSTAPGGERKGRPSTF